MSIALETSNPSIEIQGSGFGIGAFARLPFNREEQEELEVSSSSSTSSIGQNSDVSGKSRSDDDENEEVQSHYKGTLDSMESLEEVLPIRRGISSFYNGKSKSYTSLAEASSNSINDIVKAENAYTRKRRNLASFNHIWDKNKNFSHLNGGSGISKRPISASRSTLGLAMAMSSSENTSEDSNSNSRSNSRSPPRLLPPLHPQTQTGLVVLGPSSPLPSPRRDASWRSYSLADLQHANNNNVM